MEAGIHVDSPLQYALIQILSLQNRYEVLICGGNKIEKMETGVLDHLLPYLPALEDLYANGSNSSLKLQIPKNLQGSRWFTKSTLNRFLNVVCSPELVRRTKVIRDEMSQLEEARKFQISVSAPKHEGDLDPSDTSRNELLRAMNLRFAALRGELASAFCEVASSVYSAEEITNLAIFSRHFGAAEVESALLEFLISSLRDHKVDSSLSNRSFVKASESKESLIPSTISSEMLVQYSVSPVKVAPVERNSFSTESDDSSESGGEDLTSAERSRALTRSGSCRRFASPMRRIQIGKSGARKPASLTIKGLGYFPGRDRGLINQEESSANEEVPEQQSLKKAEGDVKRMSVQDRIKIFENKQQDLAVEIEKRPSLATIGTNKSVLRRWSAGMGESSPQCETEMNHEGSSMNKPDDVPVAISMADEIAKDSVEAKDEGDEDEGLTLVHEENGPDIKPEPEESGESLTASAEWTRPKEAEFNEMLIRMMEIQGGPLKPETERTPQGLPLEQKGRLDDQYKQKRDKKLQGENAGKQAEKQARSKAMQEILSGRKAAMAPAKLNDMRKKVPVKMPQQRAIKPVPTQPGKLKTEASSASVTKRTTSSRTSLPPTRKSWPSTPPAASRRAGMSSVKTQSGLSSAGITPTWRKPESKGSPSQSVSRLKTSKIEKPQVQGRTVKESPKTKNGKSSKGIVENKKVQTVSKSTKTVKTRPMSVSSDGSGEVSANHSFYNKVTKKSSVVPLEMKRPRKSSKAGAAALAVPSAIEQLNKLPEEAVNRSPNLGEVQETEQIDALPQKPNQQESGENVSEGSVPKLDITKETEMWENKHEEVWEAKSFDRTAGTEVECQLKSNIEAMDRGEEGLTISTTNWVEIEEENQQEVANPQEHPDTSEIEPSISTVHIGSSSPRICQALSQMLQEESSEADITGCGNAENSPSMIFHKDAPKGLKRLLKFARKSKGDGNSSGWSSPSVYSEGEDDSEDPRASSKRSTDNLLLKAALHAKNFGHQKTFQSEGNGKHLDTYDQISGPMGLHRFQDSRGISSVSTTKATRSFFSLSAFRGSQVPFTLKRT